MVKFFMTQTWAHIFLLESAPELNIGTKTFAKSRPKIETMKKHSWKEKLVL